jgi:hypothetical protein
MNKVDRESLITTTTWLLGLAFFSFVGVNFKWYAFLIMLMFYLSFKIIIDKLEEN